MSDLESDVESVSSDSSDNEKYLILGNPRIRNTNYLETIDRYDDSQFHDHFRVNREVLANITEEYRNSNFYNDTSGHYGKLSAKDQVLITLWYMAHETASFRDVADRFDITISCLYRILRRVVICISNLSPQIIKWPSEEQKVISEQSFSAKGFPRVIGAIDGSHVRIDKPTNDGDSYINRKGYYSIQMQVVCDHKRKIIDLFVGYPGSVHDNRVFRNSTLYRNLEEKCGNFFLLADSGYPLMRNVLTPFRDRGQLNERQINYNLRLSQSRYVVEHCFGILKQKFRQLYHIKLRDIPFIVHIIRAACVLHNMALNDEDQDDVNEVEMNDVHINEDQYDRNAVEIRNVVVQNLPM